MDRNELKVKVGDGVVISRPTSTQPFAPLIERLANVTAMRAKSFDAGGLCFRYDGREWNGHNRIRLVHSVETRRARISLSAAEDAMRAEQAREVAMLASLLSSHHEMQWLELGVEELRRIAALHGIRSLRADSLEALNAEVKD